MKRVLSIIYVCSLWLGLSNAAAQQPMVMSPDDIAAQLFLGEIYPSGHIYVQSVKPLKKDYSWPRKLNVHGMRGSIMADELVNATLFKTISNEYPPGAEGMEKEDYNHNKSCGWQYSIQPSLKYSESDYFETAFDYCERDAKLGLYKTSMAIQEAHNVVAGGGTLVLGRPDYSSKGKSRPMTKAEEELVKKEKAEALTQNENCETNPAFLDSAVQLSTYPVLNTNFSLRISNYSDAGCGGHLMEIFIIDVLEKAAIKKSVSVLRYFGPI